MPLVLGTMGDRFGLRGGMIFYLTLGYILALGSLAKPLIRNATIRLRSRDAA